MTITSKRMATAPVSLLIALLMASAVSADDRPACPRGVSTGPTSVIELAGPGRLIGNTSGQLDIVLGPDEDGGLLHSYQIQLQAEDRMSADWLALQERDLHLSIREHRSQWHQALEIESEGIEASFLIDVMPCRDSSREPWPEALRVQALSISRSHPLTTLTEAGQALADRPLIIQGGFDQGSMEPCLAGGKGASACSSGRGIHGEEEVDYISVFCQLPAYACCASESELNGQCVAPIDTSPD